jgi:acetyl esterase/lipase
MTPEQGPYKVLLKRGEFVDAQREGRVVPFKIYYPSEHNLKKLPVVIWSHGFGGNRDGAAFLSRFLASHGYVLVHITHYGTDSSLWEGKDGHPWDILRQVSITRETTLARFMDVPFVLDQLPVWAAENGEVGTLDFENIGMSGHSFGAMTTQALAGQMFPDERGKLISLREPRLKAGILYSPVPIRHLIGEEPESHIYGPIDMPLLHMTGTKDDSPLEGHDYKRRLVVHDYAGHPEQYLQILDGGDHMVYNGTRGKLEANPLREQHEELIKAAALAFWDAYLKDDRSSMEWLAQMLKAA